MVHHDERFVWGSSNEGLHNVYRTPCVVHLIKSCLLVEWDKDRCPVLFTLYLQSFMEHSGNMGPVFKAAQVSVIRDDDDRLRIPVRTVVDDFFPYACQRNAAVDDSGEAFRARNWARSGIG